MDQNQRSLLVVDDNEMNRDVLSRHLERRGYTVRRAIDGPQAIELIQQSILAIELGN